MKAVILVAGRGSRLKPLTDDIPKCLLPYENTTPLERLIKQIKKNGIDNIIVITGYLSGQIARTIRNNDICTIKNPYYETDENIISLYLATRRILHEGIDDVIVFEGDMVADDELINYVTGTDFENKSVWFTKGKFNKEQDGGILKTDGKGNVMDIKVIKEFDEKYSNWEKLIGIMRISKKELAIFHNILKEEKETNQYYLMPWAHNISRLPSVLGNSDHYEYQAFNTVKDYEKLKAINFNSSCESREVYFESVKNLFPIEKHDIARIPFVKKGIISNGFWTVPLKIESNYNLVLDGNHSLALAKQLNLCKVPVIGFDYAEVDMWSLREELKITKKDVIQNALSKNVYPVKTVKHKFPNVKCKCNIGVDELC